MARRTRSEVRYRPSAEAERGTAPPEGRHAATHHSVNSRRLRVPATKFLRRACRNFCKPFFFGPSSSSPAIAAVFRS